LLHIAAKLYLYTQLQKHINKSSMRVEEKIFMNWACNLLCPFNPSAVDDYLREKIHIIKGVAAELLQEIDYTPTTIYRGVVLKEEITQLQPHKNFTYLSFSESKNIAYNFADTTESGFPSLFNLGEHGYIVEYLPRPQEIIFHYKMLDVIPVLELLAAAGMDSPTIPEQQEVTILQPKQPFTIVTPFKKYEGYKPYKFYA
jgi:hypothetical protein